MPYSSLTKLLAGISILEISQLYPNICNHSVDAKTDELMQRIIRERFSSHTIVAVAHKLDSILDFDKVALLNEGELVEFDSPYELLSDESSMFHKLYYSSHADDEDLDERLTLSG